MILVLLYYDTLYNGQYKVTISILLIRESKCVWERTFFASQISNCVLVLKCTIRIYNNECAHFGFDQNALFWYPKSNHILH